MRTQIKGERIAFDRINATILIGYSKNFVEAFSESSFGNLYVLVAIFQNFTQNLSKFNSSAHNCINNNIPKISSKFSSNFLENLVGEVLSAISTNFIQNLSEFNGSAHTCINLLKYSKCFVKIFPKFPRKFTQ